VYYSWILGIIAAIACALPLASPIQSKRDLVQEVKHQSQVIPTTKKWLVEKILKENPVAIEEEKVVTSAVQDDTRSGTGGGVPKLKCSIRVGWRHGPKILAPGGSTDMTARLITSIAFFDYWNVFEGSRFDTPVSG
jgi:hypothetical protein